MPILLPLVLLGGTPILVNAAKLGMVAIVTPLISGVLLATGMNLSYSYSTAKLDELDKMAQELEKAGIPLGAQAFTVNLNMMAAKQLDNLYQCLQAWQQSQNLSVSIGNATIQIGSVQTNVNCDKTVSQIVLDEKDAIWKENYSNVNRNAPNLQLNGQLLDTVVLGQAYKRSIEMSTPFFAGGPLWSSRSDGDKNLMLADLEALRRKGDIAANTKALLEFFKKHQAYPDLGDLALSIPAMMAAEGMTPSQANEVKRGLDAVAFDPGKLPDNSFLDKNDTWASSVQTIGLMNRIVSSQELSENYQTVVAATLRHKMLNMVILTLIAVGITIVIMGMATQMMGAFFGGLIAAGGSGLQSLTQNSNAVTIPNISLKDSPGGGANRKTTVSSPAPSSRQP